MFPAAEGSLAMKVRTAISLVLVLCLGAIASRPYSNKSGAGQTQAPVSEEMTTAAKAVAATGCDQELWNHVYRKTRLHVVEGCIAITGVVRHIKREADGDDHIQLTVDPEFAKLLNERNKTAQGNTLILEPVCQGPTSQPDAHAACRDFHSPVEIPKAGEKVRVVGSYVLDTEPGNGWMEIHPVSTIAPLGH
jgi:hypothetical protein